MATDLTAERAARAESDSKAAASKQEATAANEALAKLAAKEEQRGLVITLSGSVLFATNQAALLPGAQTRLDDVAGALTGARSAPWWWRGTPTPGARARRTWRCRSAGRIPCGRTSSPGGYPAEKIAARGHRSGAPVAENGTAEGRANNRRVEIVVERASHSSLP